MSRWVSGEPGEAFVGRLRFVDPFGLFAIRERGLLDGLSELSGSGSRVTLQVVSARAEV